LRLIVIVHNGLGLLAGYILPGIFKLSKQDRRTISIETGIQNSGLGLVLIFNPNLFDGLGGMAFVAAFGEYGTSFLGLALHTYGQENPFKCFIL